MLALDLLGPVVLRREGRALPLTIRKTAALLVLLALAGSLPRGRVAAWLWPALDEATGRRNLRRELARLREIGAADAVAIDGDRLTLGGAVLIDLARVQADGPGLLRSTLADGLTLDDAPAFMDWLAAERERWQARCRDALEAAADAAAAAGRHAQALAQVDELLAADPLQERYHRRAMAWLAATGRREDALARYRQCRRLLQTELGLAPMAETEALAASLRGGALPAVTTAATVARADEAPAVALAPLPAKLPAQLPLVGREAEQAWLTRAWQAGGSILVEGEGGIGKTRLVLDFVAAQGPFALARCHPADAELPLASLARALRVLAGPAPSVAGLPAWVAAELPRLLPELGPAPPPLRSDGERLRFGEAIALAWHHWAGGNFDAVVLDDWHLADAASQALLLQLIARRDAGTEPARELIVYRPELAPDAAAGLQTLRSGGAAHWRLAPLDPGAVLALVERLSGATRPERFARRLASATGGHPFHLAETLRHLAEQGLLLADAQGLWHTPYDNDTEDYRELPLPASVREAVLARVQRLPEPVQRVLDAAALAGEPLRAAMLAPACALSEVEAELALEQAFEARLLAEREGGGWRFVHDLVGQSLASALRPERRRSVHRRLALGAAAAGVPPAQVALHHEAGGEPQRAVAWRCKAAEAALQLHALDDAVQHWRRACEDGAAGDERLAIGRSLIQALSLRGLIGEARTEAVDLLRRVDAGQGSEAARLDAILAVASLFASRDENQAALDLVDRLAAQGERLDARQHASLLRVRSDALRGLGRVDESEALARAALALQALSDEERARLLDTMTMAALAAGRAHEALGHVEAALALARATGDHWSAARALCRRGGLLVPLAEAEVAEAALREAVEVTTRLGMTGQQRTALFNLCVLHSSQSRPARVLAVARECWALPPPMPQEPLRTQLRLAFVEAHVALGELGEAWHWQQAAIEDALALRQHAGLAGVVLTGLELLVLIGEASRIGPVLAAMDPQAVTQMRQFSAEMQLVLAECALLAGDGTAARHHRQALPGRNEVARVALRERIVDAALDLAEGDPAAALARLPPEQAEGHNTELRWRALAVRLAAEAASGGVQPATQQAAEAALATEGAHAVAQWLLHRALLRACPSPALAAAWARRQARLAGSLASHPVQQAAFQRLWA